MRFVGSISDEYEILRSGKLCFSLSQLRDVPELSQTVCFDCSVSFDRFWKFRQQTLSKQNEEIERINRYYSQVGYDDDKIQLYDVQDDVPNQEFQWSSSCSVPSSSFTVRNKPEVKPRKLCENKKVVKSEPSRAASASKHSKMKIEDFGTIEDDDEDEDVFVFETKAETENSAITTFEDEHEVCVAFEVADNPLEGVEEGIEEPLNASEDEERSSIDFIMGEILKLENTENSENSSEVVIEYFEDDPLAEIYLKPLVNPVKTKPKGKALMKKKTKNEDFIDLT